MMLIVAAVMPAVEWGYCVLNYKEYTYPTNSITLFIAAILLLAMTAPMLSKATKYSRLTNED
ncbi:MAG: hypothetical protein PVI21_03905 [Candidatus Woesebacteria bacterium]